MRRVKLAEALALRSDTQKRLAQVQAAAEAAARHQEGEEPPESAVRLLSEGRDLIGALEGLVKAINRTNSHTELSPGVTLTDAIAQRDALNSRRNFVTAVANAGTLSGRGFAWARQMRSELRVITAVPVADLRAEVNDLARRHRELDVQIQQANWTTDLIDLIDN